jgi:hypothetical protein
MENGKPTQAVIADPADRHGRVYSRKNHSHLASVPLPSTRPRVLSIVRVLLLALRRQLRSRLACGSGPPSDDIAFAFYSPDEGEHRYGEDGCCSPRYSNFT